MIHEAVMHRYTPEPFAQCLHLYALAFGNERNFTKGHREDDVLFMQHMVVFEVVQHGLRHRARVGYWVDRCTWYQTLVIGFHHVDECF